jgi:hypothetical protein
MTDNEILKQIALDCREVLRLFKADELEAASSLLSHAVDEVDRMEDEVLRDKAETLVKKVGLYILDVQAGLLHGRGSQMLN